jgi:hypothetical protein
MHPFSAASRHALLLLIAALTWAASAFAQAPPRAPPPPGLEPLPEIAAPGPAGDPDLEPQITITRKAGETIEEARLAGRLVWIKVTPAHGRPYFLIPDAGDQMFIRRDSFDSGLKVPLWLLFSF